MRHAIEVEGLGKRFPIGEDFGYLTIRESLAGLLRRDPPEPAGKNWALKDVSFTLDRGEVLGVIGRNGAGKTTLLRILSRITEPTEGVSRTRGRVGMLLDVGTGFHPELTGRENVFLNGSILGMSTREIKGRFDEIVSFADVERFLDTPIKRYSAGMQARLAFSVAAHLEPEILLVDEVLAVGDAAFQRKCLGKMTDVAREGRTVVFVSHNMTAVEGLCDRAIWLDGSVRAEGTPSDVIGGYLSEGSNENLAHSWPDPATAPGNEQARLRSAAVEIEGGAGGAISVETPIRLAFEYWNMIDGADLTLSVHIRNAQDIVLFNTGPVGGRPLSRGLYGSACVIPGGLLNDGTHRVELQIVKDEGVIIYEHADLLTFDVVDSLTGRGAWYGDWPGAVRPQLDWQTDSIEEGVTASP